MLGLGVSLSNAGAVESASLVTNTYSLDFDGTNDYVALPASNTLITGTNVTYACWAKITDTDRTYLIATQKGATSTNLSLSVNANETTESAGWVSALIWNGSAHGFVKYDGNIDDSAWHHYAFTTRSSAQVLYLDGEAVATGTLTFSNAASTNIGSIGSLNGANYFPAGNIDEVGIWSSVLTATEIKAIYDNLSLDLNSNSVGYASSSNLVGWWRMGDGTLDAFASYDDFGLVTDQTNATLGSNLFDRDFANATADGTYSGTTSPSQGGTHVGETYGWVSYSNATVTNEGGNYLFESSTANNAVTAWLRDSYDLSAEINDGAIYEFSLDIKVNTGSVNIANRNSATAYVNTISDTTYTTYKYYLKSNTAVGTNYMQIADIDSGQEVRAKNFSYKKVQANPGLMINMAAADIESDVPS